MRLKRLHIFVVLVLGFLQPASGMFMFYETQTVPILRVFTNLQQRLAKSPDDFELVYYLARLHAMAYSTNLIEVQIRTNDNLPQFDFPGSDTGVPSSVQVFATREARKAGLNHLTNAIALYERSILLLKKSTNISEQRWTIMPIQSGLAWCLEQSGRTNEAIAMYRKTLHVAWKVEIVGDFDVKQWANDVWQDLRAGRNPVRARYRGHIGPGVCFSEQIIEHLLRLLNPVADASEIASLKADQQTMSTLGRAITPIMMSIVSGTDFCDLVDNTSTVLFDLDGSGFKKPWAWITPKAGWLVFDPQRTGRITSALQMFGNVTFWIFWRDGYQALSALDDNADRQLSGLELRGLAVWNDHNCNGVSDPGEVIPVETLGIRSISCESQVNENGMRWNPQGVSFSNGPARATYDWIVPGQRTVEEDQPWEYQ